MHFLSAILMAGMTAAVLPAQQVQTSVAATPPMGWNSWNHFAGHVTDADVRSAADMLVSTGMRDAGYVYVNIDDTWQGTRDAQGVIHGNERFPDMKALGDYVHSKGLKFGIYSSPGAKTCAGFEGSLGHEAQDAQTYAAWGVDFLKYDLCGFHSQVRAAIDQHPDDAATPYRLMVDAYKKMGDALRSTGRPIVYSLCQYGVDEPWKFGPGVGAQMWRTTEDINDTYNRMIIIALQQSGLEGYAGPGHWNDPDMLEIGNGGMSYDEYRTHMSLWVLLAAPLLAGNDLSKMSEPDRLLLTNREAIAIDQDRLGKQAERVLQRGDLGVWRKELSSGRYAVGIVNTAGGRREYPLDLADIGFVKGASVHNVWTGKDLGRWQGARNLVMTKHTTELYIFSK